MPVRVGVSIGDSLAALHELVGVLLALYHRKAHGGTGQEVDVALYEAVFSVMESLLPEFDALGHVREPAGSALSGIAPSNAYPCSDGIVLIAGNGDAIFRRLMTCIGREDLAADPSLQANAGRVCRVKEIDHAIGDWTAGRSVDDVLAAMERAQIPQDGCTRLRTSPGIRNTWRGA